MTLACCTSPRWGWMPPARPFGLTFAFAAVASAQVHQYECNKALQHRALSQILHAFARWRLPPPPTFCIMSFGIMPLPASLILEPVLLMPMCRHLDLAHFPDLQWHLRILADSELLA